nr:EAL domain-containing protein [Solimicrobium silvestre]
MDDEPSNLATLKQILGNDYSLVFARNGTEGLAAVKKHLPALILLDVQMPDMDGYTVCKMIKADPLTENTPVIFISALSDVGDETTGFLCGGVDYIIKPVSPAIVRARVATHLSLVRATTLELYVKQLEIERTKTARLSRILAVLSGTNSAIVRIRESHALMEEACRIAVDHGGFGIAWIGLAQDNAALSIAASQGIESDQLIATLQPSVGKSPDSIEISSQVLKTGQTCIFNDVRSATSTSATCRDALSRGYLSLIALPLTGNNKIAGVVVLYARELNCFDEEEIKLLSELAGDISFALQAIENGKRASFLAYYDELTGLPNTTLFLDRLDQLIQSAWFEKSKVFVIILNLNRFKELNDTYGRHIGDKVLITVAQYLDEGSLHSCSAARIGADNFALLGVEANSGDVTKLCDQILIMLAKPFNIDGKSFTVSPRLGIAIYPTDAENTEALFKNAETALKQAKFTKSLYSYYSPEHNAKIAEKIELENMLKLALDNNQFVMYYQPKVDLDTGKIVGAEALIRWKHPERGMVPPVEFIPLAEETGLIVPIGTWVIQAVCAQQATWKRDRIPIVPVALNLSALQFRQGNVLQIVRDALSEYKLEPNELELELTESLVMQNLQEAETIMRSFHQHGLHLSLDDFGTGYSSLAYLKRFPFDTVKIDRAFVTDITRNPEDAAIALAIIAMAHNLHMNVVAEGVETEAQLKFLRARHCDQIQGYFFSPPVTADEFGMMLHTRKHIEPSVDTQDQTLLLVDSDSFILSALTRTLRGQGYRILTALGGREALEVLATNPVQVILCEQLMSEMTGAEFFSITAKLYPDTMRIILTGYTELQSVLEAINSGEIYRFLTKPWDDELIRQNILDAFRRYRPMA